MNWLFLVSLLFASSAQAVDFTIAILPDVHINQGSCPSLQTCPPTATDVQWNTTATWIVNNQAAQKIQAIFSVGDYTGTGTNQSRDLTAAWTDGWAAIDALGLPYGIAPGNHDYDGDSPSGRLTTIFDAQLGHDRISGKSWYCGYWTADPTGKTNQCITFTEPTTGRKFLVLLLEFFPRAAAMTWASGVIAANPGREIIIITHSYLQNDDNGTTIPVPSLVTQTSTFGPNAYFNPANPPLTNYSGTEIETWAAAQGPNVRAILCGHWINGVGTSSPYFAYFDHRADTALDGHTFYGTFQNWQSLTAPKFVVLMQFTATSVTVTNVAADSGTTPSFATAFTIPWQQAATPSSLSGNISLSGNVVVQ